jgi:hypothetical protein
VDHFTLVGHVGGAQGLHGNGLIELFETEHADLCERIDSTGKLDDELKQEILDISAKYRESYK